MYLDSLKNITLKLTIFYDEQCPLCLAEIHFLRHHNHKNLLDFVNLQGLGGGQKINCELAFKTIHARIVEKKIITGPEVFFEAYKRTDLKVIKLIFSFKLFRLFYAKFYAVFAKNRHIISKKLSPFLLRISKRKYPEVMK
jgi:predicted DCC family thiol-disulfide oxidoreductase YuxK